MARTELLDPLDKFRWKVTIDDFSRAGFTSCQTPSFNITTHKYKEGGAHLNPRQIMQDIDYAPITLTRGVTPDTSFNQWATGLFDLVQRAQGMQTNTNLADLGFDAGFANNIAGQVAQGAGLGGPAPIAAYNTGSQYRKDISIKHVNKVGQTIVEYNLFGAWVIGYKPASDFDATDDEGFSIESITIAYDGFDVRYGGIAGALSSQLVNSIS